MVSEVGLRASKKGQTRRAIAMAALRLFLERGFEEVSIAEIAEAAGFSKMTVFNYFPAKEDMFFEFVHGVMPDLGGAVRGRGEAETPIAALHRFVRAELERRAEWTALHDGVSDFTRVTLESPTLISGFDRIWREREQGLLAALADAIGLDPSEQPRLEPLVDVLLEHRRSVTPKPDQTGPSTSGPSTSGPDTSGPSTEVVILRVVVGQILATVQTLVLVNQLRQAQGITADASAEAAYAECDAAFALLEHGMSDYGRRPTG